MTIEQASRGPMGVVLTGYSSDLGKRLAHDLARDARYRLLCTRRSVDESGESVPEGVQLLDRCDLLDPRQCERVAEAAQQTFDGPFGIVHSVGDFWDHVPFEQFGGVEAETLFSSHVGTLYRLLHSVLPVMVSNGGGSVVTFSCNSVRYAYPWMAPFTAAKSAVESLTRSLAHEYADRKIRFNALVLASLQTEKVVHSKPHGDIGHFIPPDDVVPVVKFLLDPSSYLLSGNCLNLFVHSDRFYTQGYFERIGR